MAGNYGLLDFCVKIDEITTTCCIQWFPDDDLPECDDSVIYDEIREALTGATEHDWYDRIEAVADKYGGTLQTLDEWKTYDIGG